MINFILYETSEKLKQEYELVILNFVGIREEKFKIYKYSDYNINNTKNIYIISHKNIKTALKIATEIRVNNNWNNQIIIVSDIKSVNSNLLINKLLILDYIDIKGNYTERLKEDLYIAYKILSNEKALSFCLNSEINKIPYNDILYIEKNNNQNYCTIYTLDNEYTIKSTITNLEQELDSAFFMKTHRSCIVNLHNIEYYNCPQNIISFSNNKKIDLISRDKKKILKSRLVKEKVEQ